MLNPKLMNWLRPLTLLVVLALAFSLTSPVRAEGEVPAVPPEAAAGESSPPADSGGVPATDPAADPGGEAPLPGEPEAGLPAAESAPPDLSQVVDTLNDNNLVLENSAGEAVPLASEEAAALLAEPDPWFISGTVKYRFVGGACPPPDPAPALTEVCTGGLGNPIQAAIDYVRDNGTIPVGGAIYVDTGTFSGSVSINGSLPNLNSLKALIGKGSDISAAEFSRINNNVSITNLPGGFTLQGFYIAASSAGTPALYFSNIGGKLVLKDLNVRNASAGGNIKVDTSTASIEIRDVEGSNGAGYGLLIDTPAAVGTISIVNSEFSSNAGGAGINILTNGSILLNGVSASYNNNDGAFLTSGKGITIRNGVFSYNTNAGVTGHGIRVGITSRGNILIDSVFANQNDEDGILIENVGGNVSLANIQALYNDTGVYIDNCLEILGVCSNPTSTVTLTNITVNHNSVEGIRVISNGAVNASGITSRTNIGGSVFDNSTAKSPANISIASGSFTNSSGGTGLTIRSKGSVTLNNVSATSNNQRGVSITNTFGSGSVTFLSTLGVNDFGGNQGTGIYIDTNGAVNLSRTSAANNNGTASSYGAYILAQGNVTISGTAAEVGYFGNSGYIGLGISTKGTITLNFIDSSANPADNIIVDNSTGTGNVVMNSIIANDSANGMGIWIISTGSVNLKEIYATNNAFSGVTIKNDSTRRLPVSVSGGTFNNNRNYGLNIESSGAVNLKDINATGNSATLRNISYGNKIQDTIYSGLDEYRFAIAAPTNTTIIARSAVNSPLMMYIYRPGDVSPWQTIGPASVVTFPLTSLTILGTYRVQVTGYGAYTIFLGSGGPEPVSPTQTSFSVGVYVVNTSNGSSAPVSLINRSKDYYVDGNGRYGLQFVTNGAVTLTNVSASYNGAEGIYLSNGGAARPYVLRGISAGYNNATGVFVDNNSSVSVTDFYTAFNNNHGILIDAGGTVTLSGQNANDMRASARYNQGAGVYVITTGQTNLKWIDVENNQQRGIYVTNGGSSGGLNAQDLNAYYNQGEGLMVSVPGAVVLTKGYFTNNTTGNVLLNNNLSLVAPVTVADVTSYSAPIGINISTNGAVTLRNTVVSGTTGGGAGLYILQFGTGSGAVAVTGGSFTANPGSYGITIFAIGNVTITNVNASNNGKDGVRVDSTAAAAPRTLTVNGGTFFGNAWSGLNADTRGAITVTNARAFYNLQSGFDLQNDGAGGVGTITVTASGSNFTTVYGNSLDGIRAFSNRNILINRVSATANFGSGVFLSNGDPTYGTGNVTVTGSKLVNNMTGITVSTRGSVLVDRVNSDDNFGRGLNINVDSSVVKPVSIFRSTFISNSSDGIQVVSAGPVVLNGITADENSGYGVAVNNNIGTAQAITVLSSFGANSASRNGLTGMLLLSNGQISISNVTANNNFGVGIQLNNYDSGTGSGKVIINGALAQNNSGTDSAGRYGGVTVYSNGPVEVNNLRSFQNGAGSAGFGIYIETYNNNNARISNSSIIGNNNTGIRASLVTTGVLILINTNYFGNDFAGGAADPDVLVTH